MEQSLWCVQIEDCCTYFSLHISFILLNSANEWQYMNILFQIASMHVNHAREVPEYEINPKELDFTNSVEITKVKHIIIIYYFSF
jgi:hypothetical protein